METGFFVSQSPESDQRQIQRALARLGAATTILTPAFPLFGLLGQAITYCGAAYDLVAAFTPKSESRLLDLTIDVLRKVAEDKPTALVVDYADRPTKESGWPLLLMTKLNDLAHSAPLVVVLGVDRPPNLPEEPEAGDGFLFSARYLVDHELADWSPLRQLNASDIGSSLGGADHDVLAELIAITAGRAGLLTALWASWVADGRVVREAECWRFATGTTGPTSLTAREMLDERIGELVGPELRAVATARDIVHLAALEGATFTAAAIASALGRPSDELIAFVEGYLVALPADPVGLFIEDRSVVVNSAAGATTLCRYRFATEFWRLAALPVAAQEERALARRLVEALLTVYNGDTRTVGHVLVDLYRRCGDNAAAENVRVALEAPMRQGLVRWRIDRLMELNVTDIRSDPGLCREVALELLDANPIVDMSQDDRLAVARRTLTLSRISHDATAEVMARTLFATVVLEIPDVHPSQAADALEPARRVLANVEPATAIRALTTLAQIAFIVGDVTRASIDIHNALGFPRTATTLTAQAAALRLRAQMELQSGGYDSAIRDLSDALDLAERSATYRGQSASSVAQLIGVVRVEASEALVQSIESIEDKDAIQQALADARGNLDRALPIFVRAGLIAKEAACHERFGLIGIITNDEALAIPHFRDAARLADQLEKRGVAFPPWAYYKVWRQLGGESSPWESVRSRWLDGAPWLRRIVDRIEQG